MFKVDVRHTGSKGNATVIDDCILIDCGVAYKHIQDIVSNVDKILITHRHDDHLKLTVLKQLYKRMPWKLENDLYMNDDTWSHAINKIGDKIPVAKMKNGKNVIKTSPGKLVKQDILENEVFELKAGGRIYKIETFELDHDVQNQGFVITNDNDETLAFATDTAHLNYLPDRYYDYLVIEGNYDEDKMFESLASDDLNEVNRATRNMRHLSIQDFEEIIFKYSHERTEVYQLHESDTYGRNNGEIEKGRVRGVAKMSREEALNALKSQIDPS